MKLRVDVWSDVACPWCWIGKRRLEAALAAHSRREEVEVVWRAFELDPYFSEARSHDSAVSYSERLARRYRCSFAEAERRMSQMIEIAAAEGIELRLDRARPVNTFDAHRVLQLARDRRVQAAMAEALFRAHLTDGERIDDHDTLIRLATTAGLDAEEVRATLAEDAYDDEVREDEAEASELGIRKVPFFVFGGRCVVSGAQPPATLLRAMTQAWRELGLGAPPHVNGGRHPPHGR
jgi:predicted DsbA family dithiol-disulfide isomerase